MRKRPVVVLENVPLRTMLFAAAERYKRECVGYLLGTRNRGGDVITVTGAECIGALTRTTSKFVCQSRSGAARIEGLMKAAPGIFPLVGDFHSHTGAERDPEFWKLSDTDARDFVSSECFAAILVNIVPRGAKPVRWRLRRKCTRLGGSLGDFTFYFSAYRVRTDPSGEKILRDSRGVPLTEFLPLKIARSAIRTLNRAQASRKRA